jgi:hypothetical protein
VVQDDFQKGTGVYIVSYKETPKVKTADIKSAVTGYKLEKVALKITAKVDDKGMAGDIALTNSKEKDAEDLVAKAKAVKGDVILSGVLSEDDKGKQTLTLTKVSKPE